MVDDSGSTATTDPNDTNRVATIHSFLTTYASKTNLTFSYSYFGDNAYTFDPAQSAFGVNLPAQPFGTDAQAETALTEFESIGTIGNTPYAIAFDRLTAIIEGDSPSTSNQTYVVVFMSDGQPTDQGSGSAQVTGVSALVTQLMALLPSDRLSLSTVYFGPSDADAESNLSTMAQLGGGQFVNTNVTQTFSIDNLINVPSGACKP